MHKQVIMCFALIGLFLFVVGCTSQDAVEESSSSASSPSEDAQVVLLGLSRSGYTPNPITVEAGKPVVLKNDGSLQGCGLYVVSPELGINANFAKEESYSFTPTKKGSYTLSCSMGMFKGVINVI